MPFSASRPDRAPRQGISRPQCAFEVSMLTESCNSRQFSRLVVFFIDGRAELKKVCEEKQGGRVVARATDTVAVHSRLAPRQPPQFCRDIDGGVDRTRDHVDVGGRRRLVGGIRLAIVAGGGDSAPRIARAPVSRREQKIFFCRTSREEEQHQQQQTQGGEAVHATVARTFLLAGCRETSASFPPTLFRRRITCYPRPTSRDGGLLTAIHACYESRPTSRLPKVLRGESELDGVSKKNGHDDDMRRRVIDNFPSAGSPTETLLRLLLPLNDRVRSSSPGIERQGEYDTSVKRRRRPQPLRHVHAARRRRRPDPRTSPDRSIGSSDGRCVQRAGTCSTRAVDPHLPGIPRSRGFFTGPDLYHGRWLRGFQILSGHQEWSLRLNLTQHGKTHPVRTPVGLTDR
ncbi:unnamed protein product [Acanthosepion pharaonis]|uniref:Uncharacterized protein n=1 Tax=Acanthosepion pharaonis TaxID=158019 RepID=A0A812BQJ9_ACAPH|nr:unnamed protein product [Sepia pharaonis]